MTSYDLRVSCKCNGKDAGRRGCQHPKEQPSSFLQAGKAVVERTEVADRDQQNDEDNGERPVDFSELEEQLAEMSLLRPMCSKLKKEKQEDKNESREQRLFRVRQDVGVVVQYALLQSRCSRDLFRLCWVLRLVNHV